MPRAGQGVREIVQQAVSSAMARIIPAIDRRVEAIAAERARERLAKRGVGGARGAGRRRRRTTEMTRWVADARARRVPTFVIEATGLSTKKQIVAKYGPDAAFEKGKPLPPPKGTRSKPAGKPIRKPQGPRTAPRQKANARRRASRGGGQRAGAHATGVQAGHAAHASGADSAAQAKAASEPAKQPAPPVTAKPPIVRKAAIA